jgi:hypothetical protein
MNGHGKWVFAAGGGLGGGKELDSRRLQEAVAQQQLLRNSGTHEHPRQTLPGKFDE